MMRQENVSYYTIALMNGGIHVLAGGSLSRVFGRQKGLDRQGIPQNNQN